MARLILEVEARSGPFGRCVQSRVQLDGPDSPHDLALDSDEERIMQDLVTRCAGAVAQLDASAAQRSQASA